MKNAFKLWGFASLLLLSAQVHATPLVTFIDEFDVSSSSTTAFNGDLRFGFAFGSGAWEDPQTEEGTLQPGGVRLFDFKFNSTAVGGQLSFVANQGDDFDTAVAQLTDGENDDLGWGIQNCCDSATNEQSFFFGDFGGSPTGISGVSHVLDPTGGPDMIGHVIDSITLELFNIDAVGGGELRFDIRLVIHGSRAIPIDVKPGSDPNAINPKSKGVIPVAVLGSVDFDAVQVDVTTVEFGPAAATPAHDGHVEDVNADGFSDFVVHFKASNAGIACGDTDANLTGETFSGGPFTGTDAVKTAGCK